MDGTKSNENKKTIYYRDELNDEFSGITKKTVKIDENFKFMHRSVLWRTAAFVLYNFIMRPFAYIYCKLKFHLRIVNRRAMKECRAKGCFIYANHTLMAGDAFIPNLVSFPKRNYVVVHPDNISTPGTKNFVMMCGAIPLPQSVSALRGMMNAVEKRILQGRCVTVYPEAHIWPYYTGIRRFSSTSLMFPVKYEAPVVVSTTTYSAPRRPGGTPRVTVYVDGPFYPDTTIKHRAASEKLGRTVYETMCSRAKNNSYEAVRYVKAEEENGQ